MDGIVRDRESLESLHIVRDRIRDIVPLPVDHPCDIDSCFLMNLILKFFESFDTDLGEEIVHLDEDISG